MYGISWLTCWRRASRLPHVLSGYVSRGPEADAVVIVVVSLPLRAQLKPQWRKEWLSEAVLQVYPLLCAMDLPRRDLSVPQEQEERRRRILSYCNVRDPRFAFKRQGPPAQRGRAPPPENDLPVHLYEPFDVRETVCQLTRGVTWAASHFLGEEHLRMASVIPQGPR